MESKIQSISEAFSMQPMCLYVGGEINGYTIMKIVEEEVHIQGDPYTYYVGYSHSDKKIFEFKKGTVNVFYQ
jgi:hypothetical protein